MTRALLFPTFNMRRADPGLSGLSGFDAVLQAWQDRAARVVALSRTAFAYPDKGAVLSGREESRQAHYASYIESVAAAAWVEQRAGPSACLAGYSMGVFAALAHAGAYSFEDGLIVMDAVCVAVHDAVAKDEYAVAAIDGLPADRVRAVVREGAPGVELIDVYGNDTTVVSGLRTVVAATLDKVQLAGATYVKLTPATAPYHCSVLVSIAPLISNRLAAIAVRHPSVPVISALSQTWLRTADEVRAEIVSNVSRPMNWFATMRALVDAGMSEACECGPSEALSNMLRRDVPGDYRVRDLRAFNP